MLAALVAAMALLPHALQDKSPFPDHGFVLTGAGRFAVLADQMSIVRDGDTVTMRAFQVAEPAFTAGGDHYWGGWSRWRFDCVAETADRLDFASVREGGVEGPTSPEPSPAYAAVPGGDAAELLAVACSTDARSPDVFTLEDAVTLGRAALAGELDQPR
ncbi:hypothetical protein BH10PSE1_BH10PSE1_16330 [soil metagenome]